MKRQRNTVDEFFARGGAWVIAQAFLLTLVFGLPYFFTGPHLPERTLITTVLRWGSLPVTGIGIVLIIAGAFALGRKLTPLPTPVAGSALVTAGVFALTRHPIYGGIALLGIGAAMMDPTLLRISLAALLWYFFERKAVVEEEWLTKAFTPEVYLPYCNRTARLIPGFPPHEVANRYFGRPGVSLKTLNERTTNDE